MSANAQQTDPRPGTSAQSGTLAPAIFRAGDIGVAAEWRDLSYDWTPLLTPLGVSMYEQCRDTYDQQRALYPFLLSPQGPTKQAMQRKLGLRTGFALQGPEYILATVGLLHVEVDSYGPSADPERPNHTRVAYYVVGRLDHPTLDWAMLSRILTALHRALEPARSESAAQQKRAAAALRALGHAGFLQHCDPEDLFYPLGAWPALLPTLIADPRWEALFTELHGATATAQYRHAARAWVEYAQRLARRLQAENDAIRDQVIAAQRRGPRGGAIGPAGAALPPPNDPDVSPAAGADEPVAAANYSDSPLPYRATASQMGATARLSRGIEPGALNETGLVAALSPASRYPGAASATGSATASIAPRKHTIPRLHNAVAELSLARDQLTTSHCRCAEEDLHSVQPADSVEFVGDWPEVAIHLRDAELTSTRYDGAFWCAVNTILYGRSERYNHTPGEKKAVERRFKQQGIPVGVVLAALRAVMAESQAAPPRRFGDALTLPSFQRGVQQALALLPARALLEDNQHGWTAFLHAYRSIGQADALRNVSTTDYHVLRSLFQAQPAECWEVLNRVEHAARAPNLSPAYLRRAITNNLQAAARQALTSPSAPAPCRPPMAQVQRERTGSAPAAEQDDPRRALLEQAGLSPRLLQPWMTDEYIRAWLDEAAARPNLENVQGWLIWGLAERCLPHEHPRLPPRPVASRAAQRSVTQAATGPGGDSRAAGRPTGSPQAAAQPQAASADAAQAERELWSAVLAVLERQLARSEFETWLRPSALLHLADGRAVVGVPHIFARERLQYEYLDIICEGLEQQLGYPVEVDLAIT